MAHTQQQSGLHDFQSQKTGGASMNAGASVLSGLPQPPSAIPGRAPFLLRASRPPVDESDLSPSQAIMHRYGACKQNQGQVHGRYSSMGAGGSQGSQQQQQMVFLGLPRGQTLSDITLPTTAGGHRGSALPGPGSNPSPGPLMSGTAGDVLHGMIPADNVQRIPSQQRSTNNPTPMGRQSAPVLPRTLPSQVHPNFIQPRHSPIMLSQTEPTAAQADPPYPILSGNVNNSRGYSAGGSPQPFPADPTRLATGGLGMAPPPPGWKMQGVPRNMFTSAGNTSGYHHPGHHPGVPSEGILPSSWANGSKWPPGLPAPPEGHERGRTASSTPPQVNLPLMHNSWSKTSSRQEQSDQMESAYRPDLLQHSQVHTRPPVNELSLTNPRWVGMNYGSSASMPLPLNPNELAMGSAGFLQSNIRHVLGNAQALEMVNSDYQLAVPLSERLDSANYGTSHFDQHYACNGAMTLTACDELREAALGVCDPIVPGPATAWQPTFANQDNFALSPLAIAGEELLLTLDGTLGESLMKMELVRGNEGKMGNACGNYYNENMRSMGADSDFHCPGVSRASFLEAGSRLGWDTPSLHAPDLASQLRALDLGLGFKR